MKIELNAQSLYKINVCLITGIEQGWTECIINVYINPTQNLQYSIPQVLSKDDKEIGKISKQWSGLAKEMFTDADNFGIQFPMDLDVKAKACLLGACLLIVSLFLV